MRVWWVILAFLASATGGTVYAHWQVHGHVNAVHVLLVFFLSLNLMICLWELCLWGCIDTIKERYDENIVRYRDDKSRPALDYLTAKVSLRELVSPRFWSQTWSGYAMFDGSYADKRTFGFAIDVGNGFSTLIPGLVIHVGLTHHFLPANVLGIVALLFFYQVTYGTALYWFSFVSNRRYELLSRSEILGFIVGTNAPWFLLGVLGIYASVRLILENSFAVIGLT